MRLGLPLKTTNLILSLASLLLSILCPFSTHAYPQFVVHGYTTCGSCHYNPLGNGPLTDYGRALGATLISGRPPWYDPNKNTDEKMATDSGFLGPIPLPFWLRPSVNFREMYLKTGIPDQTVNRWIEMQQEANLVLQTRDAKWIAVMNYGHAPVPATAPLSRASQYVRWLSREHYLGVRVLKKVQFYVGLLDPSYGLRLSEHTSYIMTRGSRNTYDQNHGLLVHITGKKWDAFLNPVVGNLQQAPSLRRKGFFTSFEYEPFERMRFGASVSSTKNEFQKRTMGGIYTHLGLNKNGGGVLAEVSLINDSPVNGNASVLQEVSFIQGTALLSRGLYLLMTFENAIGDFHSGQNRFVRAGPAIDWFPFQRLEFRTDFLNTRAVGNSQLTPDEYSLLVQMHVWL